MQPNHHRQVEAKEVVVALVAAVAVVMVVEEDIIHTENIIVAEVT
jgi:hypothetical protein